MKRFWMVALMFGLLVGFGLATAFTAVQAQETTPPAPQNGYGPGGMMGGRGAGRGMMGSWSGNTQQPGTGQGFMHEYMEEALAAKLDLTVEELEALHADGQTFWQIAEAKGYSLEEAQALMTEARGEALDQMVAEGVITEEQAEFMQQRMGQMQPGGCLGGGGIRGRRW